MYEKPNDPARANQLVKHCSYLGNPLFTNFAKYGIVYRDYIVCSRKEGHEMEYRFGGCCDQGCCRESNQDSLFLASDSFGGQEAVFGVICDGVGSLAGSGYASAAVVLRLREWFSGCLPARTLSEDPLPQLSASLTEALAAAGREIAAHSLKEGTPAATTASVLLICGDAYFLIHVGDSRIYRVNHDLFLLTKDHVARHPEGKTALTRCIGIQRDPDFFTASGAVYEEDAFLLCSDGFYHTLGRERLIRGIQKIRPKTDLNLLAASFVQEARRSGERDNISLGIIKRR